MNPTSVRVDISARGGWEVALSDRRDHITCKTLEEANRVAYRCALDRRPCELIVCDAYHRVVQRELIKSSESTRRVASTAQRRSSDRRIPT
jgi:hypothetical protein